MNLDITPTLVSGAVLVLILIIVETALRTTKSKVKNTFEAATTEVSDNHELELLTIRYFKQMQMFDLLRMGAYILAILGGFLIYDVQAFSYIVVALGALIIVMKENVNSIAAYFYILSHYDVGDDVKIDGNLGEIIRIRPLSLALAGKDDSGDYNGKLFQIPNYKILQNIVEVQELKSDNFRRVTVNAVYIADKFSDSFDTWLTQLKEFLSETLPLRKIGDVGHYRGFAGKKFKVTYDYDDDGDVLVRISFIANPLKAGERKEKIISYIEKTRLPATQKTNKKT
ncbi:MAG: hypothetical protein WAX38_04160 [Minisyncoccia bacterium]